MAQCSRYIRELEDFLPCGQAEALERSTNPYPTRGGSREALRIATVPSKPVAGVPQGQAALGRRLSVYWRSERPPAWFTGVVKQFNAINNEHLIVYTDGDQQWHCLDAEALEENLQWLDLAPASPKATNKRPRASEPDPAAAKRKPRKAALEPASAAAPAAAPPKARRSKPKLADAVFVIMRFGPTESAATSAHFHAIQIDAVVQRCTAEVDRRAW